MATATLAARVAQLEETVAKLVEQRPTTSAVTLRKGRKLKSLSRPPLQGLPADLSENNGFQNRQPGRDDWKKSVGMFDGDDLMKRIIERGAAIRRAESRKARRG